VGLLDELSKYKFNPNATSMGLLQAGAQMLANSGPSYQPQGGFGSALGQGLGGFTQGYMGFNQNHQDQEMIRQRMELERKKLAQEQFRLDNPQRSVDPYTSIERGPNGELYLANHRETDPTKVLQRVLVDGGPVRAGSLDPLTQGAIVKEKEKYKGVKFTDDQGREGVAPQGVLNPAFNSQNPVTFETEEVRQQVMNSPEGQSIGNSPYKISPSGQAMGLSIKGSVMGPSIAEQEMLKAQGAGAKKAAELSATAQTNAAIDMPKVDAQSEYATQLLDKVLSHPGMPGVVGMPNMQGLLPFPGTKEADFKVLLNQIKGQQFLSAFESLRGGGQITEREGRKATDAMARLDTSQSEDEFKQAVSELQGIIGGARERAKQKAGGVQQGAPIDDKRARLEALRAKHLRQQQ
jgi:hypothetical protein